MKLVQDVGIGENIRALRLQAGLTQDQVVAQMQIRGLQISRPSLKTTSTIYEFPT